MNSIGEGVISTDTEGRIVRMNPAAEQLTGRRFEEAAGGIIWEFFPLENVGTGDQQLSPVKELLNNSGGTLLNEEAALTARDGVRRILRISTSIIRDENGIVRGTVSVFYDMTERKELEQRLIRSQKMEAIGQLAGGVAHDFNNLLAGIMAYAGLLRETEPNAPEFGHYLESILEVTKRAGGITRQLLEYSRQSEWRSVPLSLHRVITDAFDIILHASGGKIRIGFDLRASPDTVEGDATRLEQVFLNIGMNAKDAMPDGGTITVLTRVLALPQINVDDVEDLETGRYIVTSVKDSGKGIAPEIITKIFDPFFTTKETGKGTGLGLASAYGIVKTHHGHITVTSAPGLGTEFRVYLPLEKKQH